MNGRGIDEGGYLGDRSIRRVRRTRGDELDTRKVTRYRSYGSCGENEVHELTLVTSFFYIVDSGYSGQARRSKCIKLYFLVINSNHNNK